MGAALPDLPCAAEGECDCLLRARRGGLADDDSTRRPGGGRQARRAFAEAAAGSFPESVTTCVGQAGEVRASRADAGFEGRPPIVECLEVELDGQVA